MNPLTIKDEMHVKEEEYKNNSNVKIEQLCCHGYNLITLFRILCKAKVETFKIGSDYFVE